jgi:hypothetical protein
MIATLTSALKGILGLNKKISEKEIECAIDENIVECTEMEEELYTGVPAPDMLIVDPWFGPAVISDLNKDYMEQETLAKQQEQETQSDSVESDNIHQEMYELATKSGATTLQLDPIGGSENFQGGSENVHR